MSQQTRTPIIAGNWKMNGSADMAQVLTEAVSQGISSLDAEVVLIPPHPYLSMVRGAMASSQTLFKLGAQDLSAHDQGAHTGEVSGAMLVDCGCQYVLVGHSERRADHHESNQVVAAKFMAAQRAGLIPIVCLGETLAQREAGQTDEVVLGQLDAVIAVAGIQSFERAVIAYEPVWAIGTGKTATPDQAQSVHASIRARIRDNSDIISGQLRVIYGGSVKPDNAEEILSREDIDGGLIGGASLEASSFLRICQAAC